MTSFEGMTEEDQLSALMAELKDSNVRQSVMEYIANKSEVAPGMTDKQRLSKMIETIAAESVTNQKQSALWKSRTKKSILLGIVAVIVAITVQFLVNFFSNELSKESHVTGKGTMVGTDGSVVKTQMDEMRVNADGQLQGRSSVKTIKTTPSLNKIALASSLPDSTLMALDEVTVYSDKGHTLRIKVQGFARIPVLNSRCGNLVHFYTAWNGRITLDSTELSFDKATESQFKDAGFSLAVGGFNGRRLAGGSRSMAFFKHVDSLKKSGSWTCADVALPTSLQTSMTRESVYEPCTGNECYSDFGGLKLGVAKLAQAHALAAMPVTSRMRALLKGSAQEVFYVKYETTNINSPSYALEIATQAAHFGQEKITLIDGEHKATFQVAIGDRSVIAHCVATKEEDQKNQAKAKADPAVDSDLHMEFLGVVQEEGKVLRHWRWYSSKSLTKAQGGKGYFAGEFWDFADTLVPYRTLDSTSGSVYVVESFSAKCTDADVQAALSLRTTAAIKDLLACKAEKADEEVVPQMKVDLLTDLDTNEVSYYIWQIFGDQDSATATSVTGDKNDALTQVADYLVRGEKGWSDGSVSDPCYLACKDVMDAEVEAKDTCTTGAHEAVVTCLKNAHPECQKMPWVSVNAMNCDNEAAATSERALEEVDQEEAAEALVPANDEGVADLFRSSPAFQAAVAQSLGAAMPKVTVNQTRQLNPRRSNRERRLRFFKKPNCTTHWCGECWSQPKNKKTGQPAGTSFKQGGGCNTCNWGLCFFSFKSQTGQISSTLNFGQFLCLSFSICLTRRITMVMYIKFQTFNGVWMFSIIVEICVDDYQMVMGFPDPWYFCCCLGGQLHIFLGTFCKDNGRFRRGGGCYIRKDINIRFRFFCFTVLVNVLSIELGIQWGHGFHKWKVKARCWRTDGRRRRRRHRRRWWNRRRRRANWGCHWRHYSSCDTYTRWYLKATFFGLVAVGFECYEWTKAKKKEGFLFGEFNAIKGFGWRGIKWKWQRFGNFCTFRKYNR